MIRDLQGVQASPILDEEMAEKADAQPRTDEAGGLPDVCHLQGDPRSTPDAANAWPTIMRLPKPGGESMNGNSASWDSATRPVPASGCELGT